MLDLCCQETHSDTPTTQCSGFLAIYSTGRDMIRPINLKPSNGYCFILIVINYFTKQVEAAFYVNVMQKVIHKFFKRDIICEYKLLETVITDKT